MKKYILCLILFSFFVFANSQEKKEGAFYLPAPYLMFSQTPEFEEYQFELFNKIADQLDESGVTDIDKIQEAHFKRSFDERKKEFSLMDVGLHYDVDIEAEYWLGGDDYVSGFQIKELEFKQNQLIKNLDVWINDDYFYCEGNGFSDLVKKRILNAKKGDVIKVEVAFSERVISNPILVQTFE